MRKTIFLPDEIGSRLEDHLKNHPNETASSVIQEALEMRLRPKRPLSDLLKLAGFATGNNGVRLEDLQPEDQWVLDKNATR